MKFTNLMSLKILKLKNSLVSNGSWFPTKISKKKDFMKNARSLNLSLINLTKIPFMEKIKKAVIFLSMVFQFTLTILGMWLEAKKNLIYQIKEKWLLNIDVTKSKEKPFKQLKLIFKNSKLIPKMGQSLTLRNNVKKS